MNSEETLWEPLGLLELLHFGLLILITHETKQNITEVIIWRLCTQYKQVDLSRALQEATLKHHLILWRAAF